MGGPWEGWELEEGVIKKNPTPWEGWGVLDSAPKGYLQSLPKRRVEVALELKR